MGNLWRLIQARIDDTGVTEATLAKRIGTSPQTLNSWKNRGIREVPSTKLLRALAAEIRQPYPLVFLAASVDAEKVSPEEADELSRSIRWSAQRSEEVERVIAHVRATPDLTDDDKSEIIARLTVNPRSGRASDVG